MNDATREVGSHLLAELREGAGLFLRTLGTCTGLGALLFGAGGLVVAARDPELSLAAGAALALVVAPLYGAFQGATLGVPLGAAAVSYRVLGPALLLPILGALVGLGLAGWAGSGWTASALDGVRDALGSRAQELGSLPGARIGHPVALLVLIPVLLLHFGASPEVLVAVLWLVAVATLVLGGGVLGGLLVTVPPTLVAAAGRLRARAAARREAARTM